MEISQLTPAIAKVGDSISNYAFEIRDLLIKNGFKSNIYVEHGSDLLEGNIKNYKRFNPKEEDIIILHASIGSNLTEFFKNLKCKKIIIYHNHTPSKFFEDINEEKVLQLRSYEDELKTLIGKVDKALAVSEYNKLCLEKIGFKNVICSHLFINFNRFKKEDERILKKFDDDYVNIISVGRIVPNKKPEDIIKIFYYYKKFVNEKSRLFLIGGVDDATEYYIAILNYIEKLKLRDVHFIEWCSEEELTSYYRLSDIFLYMSEHEGIGLPLIEAMYFNIPIIAYNATAVPYTLGNAGILVDKKDYRRIAELINIILNDKDLKDKILKSQSERLKYFDSGKLQNQIVEHILDLKSYEGTDNKKNLNELKILYVLPGGVGDIIMSTPIFRALKYKYPNVKIDFLTRDYCKDILIGNPNINKIFTEENSVEFQSYLQVFRPYIKTQLIPDWQKTNMHIVNLYAGLCGIKLNNYQTEVYPLEIKLEDRGIKSDDNYICLHVQSTQKEKDWPYFRELINKLKDEFKIVIIDEQQHNYLNTIQLPPNMKLREKAYIISKSKMLIGVDSMGIHIACALKIPTIAVYGNTLPELCRPLSNNNLITIKPKKRCTEGWHHKCKEGRYCINSINVDDVLKKIEVLLPKCKIY